LGVEVATKIKSVRAIAKAQRTTVSEVNQVIECWAAVTVNRSNSPGSTSCRRSFYERALAGDVPCGADDPEEGRRSDHPFMRLLSACDGSVTTITATDR
jgi:hypothetical protein